MKARLLPILMAATLGLAGCAGSPNSGGPDSSPDGAGQYSEIPGLQELVDAAQEEGELVVYFNPSEDIFSPLVKAFADEFGIKAEGVRLSTPDFTPRFQAEAESGADVADVLVLGSQESNFWQDMLDSGYTQSLWDSNIPQFPEGIDERWQDPGLGIASLTANPAGIIYNVNSVDEADVPKDWSDLADPKWRGQIVMSSPKGGKVYVDFYYMLQQKYGDAVLRAIGENTYRYVDSAVPLGQLVAAGEAKVGAISNLGAAGSQINQGLPLGLSVPDFTAGTEQGVGINAHAKHPNAARLFAWFLWYGKGVKVLQADQLTLHISQEDQLPGGYTKYPDAPVEFKDRLFKMLGMD